MPQRLQQESNVGNRSQEGSKDEIRRKIDENRPFADLEKLVFGGSYALSYYNSYNAMLHLPSL